MGAGQVVHLAPNRAHLVAHASVKTYALVQYHIAHRLLLHVVVVACDHCKLGCVSFLLLLGLRLGDGGHELLVNGIETIFTLVLGLGALGKGVALGIAEVIYLLLEVFVLLVVRIVALHFIGAELGHKFLLHTAVLLYLFVGELDSLEHIVLGDLLHFAFHHHYVLLGCSDHKLKVCTLGLGESGVDYKLTVDTGHAHFADRASEGEIGSCERCGCGEACQGVGLNVLLGADEAHLHKNFQMEIIRPQGADGPVYETGDEHLVVRGLAFTLEEASGEASC